MQEQYQKVIAAFLKDFAQKLLLAPCNDYDLTSVLSNKEDRRKFVKDMATYYQDEEELEALEEDPNYDPAMSVDWMIAKYLAFQIDLSVPQDSSSK